MRPAAPPTPETDAGPPRDATRPLRILSVVGRFPKLSETFVLAQAQSLLDRGHDVRILAWEASGELLSQPLGRRLAEEDRVCVATTRRGIPRGLVRAVAAAVRHPLTALRLTRFWFRREPFGRLRVVDALRHMPRRGVDIVHFQFGHEALALVPLVRIGFIQGALVAHFRGWDASAFVRKKGPGVYGPLWDHLDLVLVNGEHLRAVVEGLGCPPDRIAVSYSPIVLDDFPLREHEPDGEVLRLLSVGRLAAKKGLDDALKALPSVLARRPVTYTIVGAGEEEDTLRAVATDLGVEAHVDFTGPLDQGGVLRELRRAHVFLSPNKTAPDGDTDGPVNTVKEAMAVGVPVVASDHPGLRELVAGGRTALVAPAGAPSALADAVLRMASDQGLRRSLARAGREHVEASFSTEAVGAHLESLYRKVLA